MAIVWVNRLSKETSEEVVRDYFGSYGKLLKVTMCPSRQYNNAYCFLEYGSDELAKEVAAMEHTLGDSQLQVAMADPTLYERSIRRSSNREKLSQKVDEEIKDMSKSDAYYYGFAQGKRYMMKNLTKTTERRSVRYDRPFNDRQSNDRTNDRTNDRANDRTNDRANDRANDRGSSNRHGGYQTSRQYQEE